MMAALKKVIKLQNHRVVEFGRHLNGIWSNSPVQAGSAGADCLGPCLQERRLHNHSLFITYSNVQSPSQLSVFLHLDGI